MTTDERRPAAQELSIEEVVLTSEIASLQRIGVRQVQRWIARSQASGRPLAFKASAHQLAALYVARRLASLSSVNGVWLVKKDDLPALLAYRRPAGRPRRKV